MILDAKALGLDLNKGARKMIVEAMFTGIKERFEDMLKKANQDGGADGLLKEITDQR